MASIAHNLAAVRERIAIAAKRSERDASKIKLVAVSKTMPASAIREAFEVGQRSFGENYAQELSAKAQELADLPIEWHFIGHLQRNKAKLMAPTASYIETVDSAELAEAIDRRAIQKIKCLIEVNVAGEASKSGVAPNEVSTLVKKMLSLANIELCGLMTIPPYDPDPEKSRHSFKELRKLRDAICAELKIVEQLRDLSMGMSHDLEVAIEEGATIVRVGTAIFGGRA